MSINKRSYYKSIKFIINYNLEQNYNFVNNNAAPATEVKLFIDLGAIVVYYNIDMSSRIFQKDRYMEEIEIKNNKEIPCEESPSSIIEDTPGLSVSKTKRSRVPSYIKDDGINISFITPPKAFSSRI